MLRRFFLVILILFFISGCAGSHKEKAAFPPAPSLDLSGSKPSVPQEVSQKPVPALVLVPGDKLPAFSDDMDLASLESAMEKSLQYYDRTAGNGPRRMGDALVDVREQREALVALKEILRGGGSEGVRKQRILETFDVYQSTGSDGKKKVLFTGYFEPIMDGSLEKTEKFQYPIYKSPDDAVLVNLGRFGEKYKNEQLVGRVKNGELIPYYSRREIEELGSLAGRNLEIAWVDDRINLFFLHTQGSGKIRLPDGNLLQIGYSSKNGRPFKSIGRFLLDSGKITPQEISYQAIKRHLREHTAELPEILGYNESFIFFREVKEGPVGSLGVILTSGRSIATDAAIFPKGALAFMRLRKPVLDRQGNIEAWVPFSRFVLNQDAGGMIKGPGRVDIFCGSGDDAETIAGSFKEQGELFFLVKKPHPE